MLSLLILAGVGSLFLADMLTEQDKQDAAAMQPLTSLFADRGELEPGSMVRLRRIGKSPEREGPGINVEVTPAAAVLARREGLRALAQGVAREVPHAYGSVCPPYRWLRVRMLLPGNQRFDTFLARDADGELGDFDPPLPATWPASGGAPPAPPVPPRPGSGPEAPGPEAPAPGR